MKSKRCAAFRLFASFTLLLGWACEVDTTTENQPMSRTPKGQRENNPYRDRERSREESEDSGSNSQQPSPERCSDPTQVRLCTCPAGYIAEQYCTSAGVWTTCEGQCQKIESDPLPDNPPDDTDPTPEDPPPDEPDLDPAPMINEECFRRDMRVAPVSVSPYLHGYPDAIVSTITQRVNYMYNSALIACTCGAGNVQWCSVNAYAFPETPGYIYYDPNLFVQLSASGSLFPIGLVIAHEAGHNFQNVYGTHPFATLLQKELSADCYAGFYMGWENCLGSINEFDIQAAFMTACSRADGTGNPWFDVNTHGTCQQRQDALLRGVNGYQNNENPLQVCTF